MARDQDRTSVRDLGKKDADRPSEPREQPGKTPVQAEGDPAPSTKRCASGGSTRGDEGGSDGARRVASRALAR